MKKLILAGAIIAFGIASFASGGGKSAEQALVQKNERVEAILDAAK